MHCDAGVAAVFSAAIAAADRKHSEVLRLFVCSNKYVQTHLPPAQRPQATQV
jgi:hypothetical protein